MVVIVHIYFQAEHRRSPIVRNGSYSPLDKVLFFVYEILDS